MVEGSESQAKELRLCSVGSGEPLRVFGSRNKQITAMLQKRHLVATVKGV